MKKIIFRLRDRLHEKNMRVADLARHTGIRRSTLDLLYKNKAQKVDLEVISKLCFFFKCNLDELLELQDKI